MTGPSAIGSENGTPTSITSAPASSSPFRSSTVSGTPGSPAVMYGTSARLPFCFIAAKRDAISFLDEVVANPDAISFGTFCLDDRAAIRAMLVLVGEVGKITGVQNITHRITNDANDRSGKHLGDRVDRVDDPKLQRIEDDQRADGIDAGQVDEGLHHHRVHATPRVVPHLADDVSGRPRGSLIYAARGRCVEPVADRHDLAEHAQLAWPDRPRVPAVIGLHVVL